MGRTRVSGPIVSLTKSNGQNVEGRSASVTVSTLAAAAEEEYTITDADATVGDIIVCSFDNAGMETGMCICGAWVSANGTIKVRVTNVNAAAALVGGSRTLRYQIMK
jgi:histidyl-tRNA synthetase